MSYAHKRCRPTVSGRRFFYDGIVSNLPDRHFFSEPPLQAAFFCNGLFWGIRMNERDENLFKNYHDGVVTHEWLEERLKEAAYCVNTRIRGGLLAVIVDLAMRSRGFNVSGLDRLRDACSQRELELSGTQVRLLLMLAQQALRSKGRRKTARPQLTVVPVRRVQARK